MASMQEIADFTGRGAEQFVTSFYSLFDTQRQAAASFYTETATVVWNGIPQAGLDAVRKLFTELPSSKHTVLGFDAQPVFDGAQDMMMINVHGNVVYGEKQARQFTQDFMLVGQDTSQGKVHRITSDAFRFVGDRP